MAPPDYSLNNNPDWLREFNQKALNSQIPYTPLLQGEQLSAFGNLTLSAKDKQQTTTPTPTSIQDSVFTAKKQAPVLVNNFSENIQKLMTEANNSSTGYAPMGLELSQNTQAKNPVANVPTSMKNTSVPKQKQAVSGTTLNDPETNSTTPAVTEESTKKDPTLPTGYKVKTKKSHGQKTAEIIEDGNGNRVAKKLYNSNGELTTERKYKGDEIASETHFKNGKKVSEEDFEKKNKTEFNENGEIKKTVQKTDDGITETVYQKDANGQINATVKTFNEKGALTSAQKGTGANPKDAQDAANTAEDVTKGGTSRKLKEDKLKDAAFIDKESAIELIDNEKVDPKQIAAALNIKGADGKALKPEEIKEAIKSGDLELYQKKDGKYLLQSKVEPKDGKDVAKYSIEEKEQEKDFFTKAMDSEDPFKMMMALMMMNMMGGMMGGMNPMMAQYLGTGQEAKPQSAWDRGGIISALNFDGYKNSDEYKEYKLNKAQSKADIYANKAEHGKANFFQRMFGKTNDDVRDEAALKRDEQLALVETLGS